MTVQLELFNQDCLEALRGMPDNSVDSLVCDPPAGISFMGKDWDADKGGRDGWVAWLSEVMGECKRVLKPGAHGLVWAIPRTSHWTMSALENAGFEIRDVVTHLFGCLSEDTELLTSRGWVQYQDIELGDLAVCYNLSDASLKFSKVEEKFIYDYDDTAYRLRSDSTDQIVSRNHRCIVERGGRNVFRFAETLEFEEKVPVLEDLQGLLTALSVPHEGSGSEKRDLWSGLSGKETKGGADGGQKETGRYLPALWERVLDAKQGFSKGNVLFQKLYGKGLQLRSGAIRKIEGDCTTRSGWLDGREHEVLRSEHERGQKSSLERRGNVFQKAWELCTDKVRALSERVYNYGSQGRLCYGTSLVSGSPFRSAFNAEGSGSPYQPQSPGQPVSKFNVIQEQSGSQIVRASRFTRTDVVRVEPIKYRGKVWCVRVETGAFVARRNGKIFVTGNSGFPKSLDVSKAIDKAAGAKRPVIGKGVAGKSSIGQETRVIQGARPTVRDGSDFDITAPATPEAQQWQGWGTALKPAAEFWILCRKPLGEKTVAANVLKHGTGALNIDGCRIGYASTDDFEKTQRGVQAMRDTGRDQKVSDGWDRPWQQDSPRSDTSNVKAQGRFPANLVFSHSEGCGETCASDCAVRALDEQSGPNCGAAAPVRKKATPATTNVENIKPHASVGDDGKSFRGDSGGASRFFKTFAGESRFLYCAKASKKDKGANNSHPTVKSTALMQYLIKLVTPPGGTVLDPFMGSGSTGVAALSLGHGFYGIEKEPEYFEIACGRIAEALEKIPGEQIPAETTTEEESQDSPEEMALAENQ